MVRRGLLGDEVAVRTLRARHRPVLAGYLRHVDVSPAFFDEVGGLREDYVQGGFEDSDFCLRLIEADYDNWYLAGAELYHLEAQSFPISLRSTNAYNAWLQTHTWNDRINQLMNDQPRGAESNLVAVG